MAEETKDTIYIDVDDEITTVIDKVLDSGKKLVALVLPKRASVFQSIVNMKLLKRKSDEAGKNIVLVTNEASLLPLAGAVGLHVASTLGSKPEIPAAPVINEGPLEANEDESIPIVSQGPSEGHVDLKDEALKELSKPKTSAKTSDEDTILLDNSEEGERSEAEKASETAMPAAAFAGANKSKKAKKNKALKIPNFNRFRLYALLVAVGVIIIIVLWLLFFDIWPHATIDIKTNAENVNASLTFNLNTSASRLSSATNTLPARQVSETKTYSGTANATGQQNNGQKASGNVTFSYQDCDNDTPPTIPAGTGIVQDNLTYITQSSAAVDNYEGISDHCVDFTSGSTPIEAQDGGSSYNTSSSSATFSVPDYSTSSDTMSATGGASGGTDDLVTVVSQQDITNAQNNIQANTSGAKSDLSSQLEQENYYPLKVSFNASSPSVSPSVTVGTAASSVTVTETIKYAMYGTVKKDLNTLLNDNIRSQVGSDQSILSNGLSDASYSPGTSATNISLTSNAIVGPDISVTKLKKQIVGLKAGQIETIVKANPNVASVSVNFSPFYVSKAPGVSKITINLAKPTNKPQ